MQLQIVLKKIFDGENNFILSVQYINDWLHITICILIEHAKYVCEYFDILFKK